MVNRACFVCERNCAEGEEACISVEAQGLLEHKKSMKDIYDNCEHGKAAINRIVDDE